MALWRMLGEHRAVILVGDHATARRGVVDELRSAGSPFELRHQDSNDDTQPAVSPWSRSLAFAVLIGYLGKTSGFMP